MNTTATTLDAEKGTVKISIKTLCSTILSVVVVVAAAVGIYYGLATKAELTDAIENHAIKPSQMLLVKQTQTETQLAQISNDIKDMKKSTDEALKKNAEDISYIKGRIDIMLPPRRINR